MKSALYNELASFLSVSTLTHLVLLNHFLAASPLNAAKAFNEDRFVKFQIRSNPHTFQSLAVFLI